ncbi:MAG: hypothetical protein WD381_04025, partial [Balneolaceae bacterium]
MSLFNIALNKKVLFLVLIFLSFFTAQTVKGQTSLSDVGFSGVFFFSFENTTFENETQNEFALKRGYITFRRNLTDDIQVRFTQDVSIDRQGDGEGDIELRLKYALVNYSMGDAGIFKNSNIEFGVVNRPWINFEQDVNDFRSQRSMFLDQNGFLSSADYGITFETGFGSNLEGESSSGLKSNPAKYGSFSVGIYNGGGYSSLEKNNNKLLESRLSLRPLADLLPGFQASVFGVLGKGNIPESPDFNLLGNALSYEAQKFNMVVQGFLGEGDGSGQFVENLEAYNLEGWSMFFDIRPFKFPLSLNIRHDELYNADLNHFINRQSILGLAYIFENKSKLIVDVSSTDFHENMNEPDFYQIEFIT